MKFAFLVHPLGNETDRVLAYLHEVDLQRSFARGMPGFFQDLHVAMTRAQSGAAPKADVHVIDEFKDLVSDLGARTDGRLYEIPMTSRAILDDPDRALTFIGDAIARAADWGARIAGLGAMTGIVGSQGEYLAARSPISVTTGNSLTVYAAVTNLEHACRGAGFDLADEVVTVVGIPGSIATAAARILRPKCSALQLVARQPSARAQAIAAELGAALVFDIAGALAHTRVVLSATSSGGCIDQAWLSPGTILSDVGVPTDTLGSRSLRPDVLILSGGLCEVPGAMPRSSRYLWFHQGAMAACVAETVVCALDESPESLSLGRSLDLGRIAHIGRRAAAHGFNFARLFSFGQPLDDSDLVNYRKALARRVGSTGHAVLRPSAAALGGDAGERFRRHMNPAMMALGGGLIPAFVRGEGSRVWDSNGRSYLDFVAGYGSLNLGHNHPAVVAAVQAALADQAPGFSPAAVNPLAAALAEQLAALAPPGLEMTFFANSGAEAVEAALKLARRATGRREFLYCERSFHGKTLGALAVTGNRSFQRPFEPLLPGCEAVPFGDLAALERALASRRFAAFVVEPLQAEGGMIVPPDGYLRAAQELCRGSDTLLAVDEVQTGLGRTGALFAVDREGVEPDVMALAKSLGGGLVPIGAMLTRRALWLKAYGTLDSFALHTSTFGGGSLAAAAGLATLQALRKGDIVANAEARGRQLLDGLRALANRTSLIREVRGRGLLIGVEFAPPPASNIRLLKGLIADGAGAFLIPGLETTLSAMTATHVMALLMQEHGIYTQVARSHPSVLRLEPPLILTDAEAAQCLDAVGACCDEVGSAYATFDQMIAKAILGEHGEGLNPAPA